MQMRPTETRRHQGDVSPLARCRTTHRGLCVSHRRLRMRHISRGTGKRAASGCARATGPHRLGRGAERGSPRTASARSPHSGAGLRSGASWVRTRVSALPPSYAGAGADARRRRPRPHAEHADERSHRTGKRGGAVKARTPPAGVWARRDVCYEACRGLDHAPRAARRASSPQLQRKATRRSWLQPVHFTGMKP